MEGDTQPLPNRLAEAALVDQPLKRKPSACWQTTTRTSFEIQYVGHLFVGLPPGRTQSSDLIVVHVEGDVSRNRLRLAAKPGSQSKEALLLVSDYCLRPKCSTLERNFGEKIAGSIRPLSENVKFVFLRQNFNFDTVAHAFAGRFQ
jgi:hypothetical protein